MPTYLDGQGSNDGLGVDQAGVTQVVQACNITTFAIIFPCTMFHKIQYSLVSVVHRYDAASKALYMQLFTHTHKTTRGWWQIAHMLQ